jgi:hypothetical protein
MRKFLPDISIEPVLHIVLIAVAVAVSWTYWHPGEAGASRDPLTIHTDSSEVLSTWRPAERRVVLARLAVRERLRPMWTTTISTIVAMLPLLVFPTEGEFWTGLAVTVTGGLLAATLLAPLASVALLARKPRRLW